MKRLGNYEIVRLIGEGGFGYTYEGRHIFLDKKACLKQNKKITPEDEELLLQEIRLLWDVHHHSLPAMRDFFKAPDGSHVLVMSFEEGKTLEDAVKKHKAIHPEDIAWVTQRTLQTLYYLHSRGIVHGDIKPGNIIVKPEEHNIVLIDYGLASFRPKSGTAPIGYTEIFVAPEIKQGKPPLPESDLYSLSLTMIYALGGDPIAQSLPDQVPQPMQEFCMDLIRYNPIDRPNWDKQDLVARLSDVREKAFGRKYSKKKE